MKQDKFLIGILVFIGVLVVAALALFFTRNDAPTYKTEDAPGNVVFNFALAIQQSDLERAYGYLADQDNKPTLAEFTNSFQNGSVYVGGNALQVEAVTLQGQDHATVQVTIQYMGSGPFDTGYSNQDHATLVKQNGSWKILTMPYPYWAGDWYLPTSLPMKQP